MISSVNRLMTTSRRRTDRRSSKSAGEAERTREACRTTSDISVAHARIERGIKNVDAEIDQHIRRRSSPAGHLGWQP
jgi:hypothetical protein